MKMIYNDCQQYEEMKILDRLDKLVIKHKSVQLFFFVILFVPLIVYGIWQNRDYYN
jgi:hypothetical protein